MLTCCTLLPAQADEGMWLLPLLKTQNAQQLKNAGLMTPVDSIYNENGLGLKDAVVIFGNGCTGEVISSEGLVLTNHHCGYGAIQQHSSVEHDYLKDGFWAMSRQEELPTPGLKVTFIDRIDDVTDYVQNELNNDTTKGEMDYLSPRYLNKLVTKKFGKVSEKGIQREIKPLYGGNKYYLFTSKIYTDIRMVGAPPSSIGKFGADTDNWMWPRHTGDFSLFRIYADSLGNPASYSASNVPLKPKKWFKISIKGYESGDYAMIMGFPGSTNRFYTSAEVESRKNVANKALIEVRSEREKVLLEEMLADPKVRIQYASKYASSSNYHKNSIGMNDAIEHLKIVERKKENEELFKQWAQKNGKTNYLDALNTINKLTRESDSLRYQQIYLRESMLKAVEFAQAPSVGPSLTKAIEKGDKLMITHEMELLKDQYASFANANYNPEVDRKVAKAIIGKYLQDMPKDAYASIFQEIDKKYKGNYSRFVDECFKKSIFANKENFDRFTQKPGIKKINNDPMIRFSRSVRTKMMELTRKLSRTNTQLSLARKTYIAGLMEMNADKALYPDANFTLRLSYGNVKPYDPKDGISYHYQTTLKGVMEKEDPNNWEFVVPEKLKELWQQKEFGAYGLSNGSMPVNFLTTNDITGGNSGSPVLNCRGELLGCAFDGNWEAMSGDIIFEPNVQRTINVDIRYILFIIDKFAGASHLVKEMDILR